MKIAATIVLTFAVLVLVGGIMGYQKAASLPSLIAGIISSLVLFACAFGMFKESVLAYSLSLVATMFLALFFTYRFSVTGAFMPAGMMAIVSATVLIAVSLSKKCTSKKCC